MLSVCTQHMSLINLFLQCSELATHMEMWLIEATPQRGFEQKQGNQVKHTAMSAALCLPVTSETLN